MAQHFEMIVETPKNGQSRARNMTSAPLERYFRRDQITKFQYEAGKKLHADFLYAGLSPKMTASYKTLMTGRLASSQGSETESRLEAQERFRTTIRDIGRALSPILIHVCCLEDTAGDWATLKGRKGRTAQIEGMTTLRLALEHLAMYYGLI